MNDVETLDNTPIEKLCLSLFYICTKFEYYLLPIEILVLCKIDIVTYSIEACVTKLANKMGSQESDSRRFLSTTSLC
jgi:hypothetical protein